MRDDDALRTARRLQSALERLPRELHPARDLWPEIAGRLGEPARPDSRSPGGFEEPARPAAGWWRVAAAVTLLAGGLLAAVGLGPQAPPGGSPVVAVGAPAAPALAAARLRQRDGALQAHEDLVAAVARRRAALDGPDAAALTAGLADLERAVADIEAALSANPNDRRLRLALAAAYRRESAWASRWSRA